MSDTALLVLDMVNRFDFEGGDRLAKAARAIVPRIETLRERFDAAGAPTIYVNDNFSHWQGQFGDLVARIESLQQSLPGLVLWAIPPSGPSAAVTPSRRKAA